jgi:hypothetical protein
LTTTTLVACRKVSAARRARPKRFAWLAFLAISISALHTADAQERSPARVGAGERAGTRTVRTATIHWQSVPLRDAIGRLQKLFDQSTFVDRRVDPSKRVSLDIVASSVEQVLTPIAAEHGWGVSRLGEVVYLGPAGAAQQLEGVAAARREDFAKLPRSQRAIFERKRVLSWPRLTEPRTLVVGLVEKTGWRVIDAERIPHDLWAAGGLSELTLADQLTLLLIGFDLTYEIQPTARTIQIVPFDKTASVARAESSPSRSKPLPPEPLQGNTKQVYSLRVAEKPVGAVARELGKQLHWQIEFDEAAIRAAGRSLDARVSFAVENVEQDELLDAVLRPAGLTYRRDGERITVVPR